MSVFSFLSIMDICSIRFGFAIATPNFSQKKKLQRKDVYKNKILKKIWRLILFQSTIVRVINEFGTVTLIEDVEVWSEYSYNFRVLYIALPWKQLHNTFDS